MAQQQEPQIDDKMMRAALPLIDIHTFQVKNDKLLILTDEEQHKNTPVPVSAIDLGADVIKSIKKQAIAKGIVINMGPRIEDKDLKVGMTVYFYRQNSEGGVKDSAETAYVVFSEYHIIAYDKGSDVINLATISRKETAMA